MIYKIFEIDPVKIAECENRDGWDTITREGMVLRRPNSRQMQEEHSSFDSAVKELQMYSKDLKFCDFVILPVFSINWEGEIRTVS